MEEAEGGARVEPAEGRVEWVALGLEAGEAPEPASVAALFRAAPRRACRAEQPLAYRGASLLEFREAQPRESLAEPHLG